MYHYNQLNLGSITHNYTRERFMQVVGLAERVDANMVRLGKAEEYHKELQNMKFLSKMYFLVFAEVRDVKLWKSLFPECHRYILNYNIPLYLKVSAWLIANNLGWVGEVILGLKTKVSGQ